MSEVRQHIDYARGGSQRSWAFYCWLAGRHLPWWPKGEKACQRCGKATQPPTSIENGADL